MTLSINLVTRGRPDRLIDTVQRTVRCLVRPDTTLMIAVDEDDAATRSVNQFQLPSRARVVMDVRPREDTLGAKYNRVLDYPASVYMSMADYAPFTTPGFDQIILDGAARFPDNICVVVNHLENASFAGLYAITHRLTELMGFFAPPYFPYWFWDHWVDDVARLIGRMSFVDVVQEKPQGKPGTQELREPGWWGTFFDLLAPVRRECAASIIRLDEFQEAPGRKEALLAHYPMIEYRSKWINDHLRRDNDLLERMTGAGPGDERYLRVKARAMAMMAAMQRDAA